MGLLYPAPSAILAWWVFVPRVSTAVTLTTIAAALRIKSHHAKFAINQTTIAMDPSMRTST
jgi:hypothetical protein